MPAATTIRNDAGVGEELGQVDANGAHVHAVGDATAISTPTTRPTRGQAVLGLGVADHEQRRLDALAADGEEGQRGTANAAGLEGAGHVAAQLVRRWSRRPSSSRAPSSSRSRRRPGRRCPRWPRRPGRRWCSRRMDGRKTATVMTIAAATPSHTHFRASRRRLDQEGDQDGHDDGRSRGLRGGRSVRLPNSCDETLAHPAARTSRKHPRRPSSVVLLRQST